MLEPMPKTTALAERLAADAQKVFTSKSEKEPNPLERVRLVLEKPIRRLSAQEFEAITETDHGVQGYLYTSPLDLAWRKPEHFGAEFPLSLPELERWRSEPLFRRRAGIVVGGLLVLVFTHALVAVAGAYSQTLSAWLPGLP